ncbi:MbnP family protein [Flavobacterium luteum]|uniref:Copper-binding protein MbnP-like domain-containing protein n=1 Tax=Flavobacterium luteum TaxID=2026654 RepID=A0A7J5AJA7_9FLAO|nr:MbnP family protein [Flavobacterium luteum]KAB1157702.1 hypothetical protein F6464_01055 [Flavobacterium luteum]
MYKTLLIGFVFNFFFFQASFAQKAADSLILKLHLKFGKDDLELGKKYVSTKKDTLQIDVFKFYISNIEIQYSDKKVYNPTNSYHLIDIENSNSLRIPIGYKNNLAIKNVFFNIGIDSTASVSGALEGDLDPTKGMYWAWQSGYINMKIEGKSSSCKTRKNEFQFHIGGYMKPSYAIRKVQLEAKNQEIDVSIDVSEFFSAIKLSKINSIMIPGKEAMELADYSIKMFKTE